MIPEPTMPIFVIDVWLVVVSVIAAPSLVDRTRIPTGG